MNTNDSCWWWSISLVLVCERESRGDTAGPRVGVCNLLNTYMQNHLLLFFRQVACHKIFLTGSQLFSTVSSVSERALWTKLLTHFYPKPRLFPTLGKGKTNPYCVHYIYICHILIFIIFITATNSCAHQWRDFCWTNVCLLFIMNYRDLCFLRPEQCLCWDAHREFSQICHFGSVHTHNLHMQLYYYYFYIASSLYGKRNNLKTS